MRRTFDLYTRVNQLIIDGVIFAGSFAAAYLIRFEGIPAWTITKQFLIWLPYLVVARLLINWKLGIYRLTWRYVSLPDALAVGRSLLFLTAFMLALRLFYPGWAIFALWFRLPLSVIALELLLSFTGSLGVRALRRIQHERAQRAPGVSLKAPRRLLLYGAGRAGFLLLKELQNHSEAEVVGFIDDQAITGTTIAGIRVLGKGSALARVVQEVRAEEVVISIATASPKSLREILKRCQDVPVPAKIIPSLQEIVEGRVSISQLREIRIEDLLGRESAEVADFGEDVYQAYAGKRILVTGAGGSIGGELVRQLLPLGPAAVALLDKDENSLYELEQELIFRFPQARIETQIADLRDAQRLRALVTEFRPSVVFHAAAHKHVPLMEKHPCEAVLNNIGGTKSLLEICRQARVERFVFVSSDKAVNPASVMGATKRAGELLVHAFASDGALPAACVRFGNVMGSRGSVIPLFQRRIAEGGPISVTHPDVARFFMTLPEAAQLVLCAGTLGRRGEVFVLDMGNPRKILDLAHEMVRLAGLEPGEDIEIAITGLRPGEKLAEELVGPLENLLPTRFEKILRIDGCGLGQDSIGNSIELLLQAGRENRRQDVYKILLNMEIGYRAGAEAGAKAPE